MGDKCSKEFFEFHKKYKTKNHIRELEIDGRQITKQETIKARMTDFYISLYARDHTVENNKEARVQCMSSVLHMVTME